MNAWQTIIVSLFGGGGFVASLALFVVPATKKYDTVQERISALEKKIEAQDNRIGEVEDKNQKMNLIIVALKFEYNLLRSQLLTHDGTLTVKTFDEVVNSV